MSRGDIVELDDPSWSAFVESRGEATPFHNAAWGGLLAECYGFRAFAIVVRHGGHVAAGLPVAEVRSPLRKRRWVALPFTDSLTPLGPPELHGQLCSVLERLREAERVRSLEVRADVPAGLKSARGLSHVLPLGRDPDVVRRTFSKSQVQRNIARSVREGVTVREAVDIDDLVGTFYELHLLTRRRQGVPIQPRRFFALIWERMIARGLGTVLVAELRGRPVASAVFLNWQRTAVYKFGASDAGAWSARPNHALFWEAIRRACVAGTEEFDFGRTDPGNEGLRAFKSGWGTDERPLVYTSFGEAPGTPGSGWVGSALAATIRHSPLWLCRALGETLYRYAA
ncbi:MAG: GNAT family N-acetyltransferase [Actinobacteria bacterium]|nr:GNAT family N-acetyltransferase [Actinomycetota bacterium]